MAVKVTAAQARKLGAKVPARKRNKVPAAAPEWHGHLERVARTLPWAGVWAGGLRIGRFELDYEWHFDLTRLWRVDLGCQMRRLAIEIDGGRWAPGGGRHATDADREKLNAAAELGWRVLHYSPQQVKANPCGVLEQIRRALG